MKFGLLLPHFGPQASRKTVLQGARQAETAGFDSVFVRDHILYEPHGGIEDEDATFYDALTTLTAVGFLTERITLGTGALIPFRNPIHLARILGTMRELIGDRVLLGLGTGRADAEFKAVGLEGVERLELLKANTQILRSAAAGPITYRDHTYDFETVVVEPRPSDKLPIWYCGGTPLSARLAVDLDMQGWLPGRITLDTIRARRAVMEERSAEQGKPRPLVGVIAPTSIADSRSRALEGVHVQGLLDWANDYGRWWVKPASGRFETADDLKGSLIAGAPEDVVAEVEEFQEAGVDHLIFDLRQHFDRWFESIELLGSEVLPHTTGDSPRP